MRLLLSIAASVVLLSVSGLPALAQSPQQQDNVQNRAQNNVQNRAQNNAQNKAAKQQAKKWAKSTPRQQLELLMQMPSEEREQYLSQLPPARREQLETLEKLPSEQREVRLRRLDILNSLSPERKQAVKAEIGSIKLMTFVQRRARLHSREFEQSYSPDELELIRDTFQNAAR